MTNQESPFRRKLFLQWMKDNSAYLSFNSRKLYGSVIGRFFNENEDDTLESFNRFISHYSRVKRIFYYKAAVIQYLKMHGRHEEIDRLTKIKYTPPEKRTGVWVEKAVILQIIDNIQDMKFKLAAKLQFYTGCRSYEILKLKWKDIENDGKVHIRDEKTNKTKTKPIPEKLYAAMIDKSNSVKDKDTYLFWDTNILELSLYRSYLRYIKRACNVVASNFTTHDFRRNYAQEAFKFFSDKKDLMGLEKVRKLMGHSDVKQTMRYLEEANVEEQEFIDEVFGEG